MTLSEVPSKRAVSRSRDTTLGDDSTLSGSRSRGLESVATVARQPTKERASSRRREEDEREKKRLQRERIGHADDKHTSKGSSKGGPSNDRLVKRHEGGSRMKTLENTGTSDVKKESGSSEKPLNHTSTGGNERLSGRDDKEGKQRHPEGSRHLARTSRSPSLSRSQPSRAKRRRSSSPARRSYSPSQARNGSRLDTGFLSGGSKSPRRSNSPRQSARRKSKTPIDPKRSAPKEKSLPKPVLSRDAENDAIRNGHANRNGHSHRPEAKPRRSGSPPRSRTPASFRELRRSRSSSPVYKYTPPKALPHKRSRSPRHRSPLHHARSPVQSRSSRRDGERSLEAGASFASRGPIRAASGGFPAAFSRQNRSYRKRSDSSSVSPERLDTSASSFERRGSSEESSSDSDEGRSRCSRRGKKRSVSTSSADRSSPDWDAQEEKEWRQGIQEYRTLYVGGILPSTTVEELRVRFQRFGLITGVHIVRRYFEHYAYVTFKHASSIRVAIERGNDPYYIDDEFLLPVVGPYYMLDYAVPEYDQDVIRRVSHQVKYAESFESTLASTMELLSRRKKQRLILGQTLLTSAWRTKSADVNPNASHDPEPIPRTSPHQRAVSSGTFPQSLEGQWPKMEHFLDPGIEKINDPEELKKAYVKGVMMHVKGVMMNVKGMMMNVKGVMMNVKGVMMNVKGVMMNVKGVMMKVKGVMMNVKGVMMNVKGVMMNVKGVMMNVKGVMMRE
ncbi:hypothetical protein M8J76_009438 [Diaphorina citri]|nr:hypothetical protein M8J76_009438 [Diaphorina citri]